MCRHSPAREGEIPIFTGEQRFRDPQTMLSVRCVFDVNIHQSGVSERLNRLFVTSNPPEAPEPSDQRVEWT